MRKVLLVMPLSTTQWGSDNAGGVDAVCQQVLQSIELAPPVGYEYEVLAIKVGTTSKELLKRQQLGERIHITFIPIKGKFYGVPLPSFIYQNLQLIMLCFDFKPDIVHSHFVSLPLICSKRSKLMITLHSLGKIGRKARSPMNNFLYEKLLPAITLRKADKITYVGDVLFPALNENVNKRSVKIANPINRKFFLAVDRKKSKTLTLVSCSMNTPNKQIDKMIELVAKLCPYIDVRFNVIGPTENSYVKGLKYLAEQFGVLSRISWLGQLNVEEVLSVYLRSDVGLLLSLEETFGLAPLEMLATGIPVIATRVGILGEESRLFSDMGVHFIDKSCDPESLDGCRHFLLNLPSVNTCALKEKFAPDAIVAQYQRVYGELI